MPNIVTDVYIEVRNCQNYPGMGATAIHQCVIQPFRPGGLLGSTVIDIYGPLPKTELDNLFIVTNPNR